MAHPLIKICGLSTLETVNASIRAGATHLGFVFFDKSPRHLAIDAMAGLRASVPRHVKTVTLLVNPEDALIERVIQSVRPDIIQFHGQEPPDRLATIKQRFPVEVWKAVGVQNRHDVEAARPYLETADLLLFDAKPPTPRNENEALPGGMGIRFDWSVLESFLSPKPWGLAGGLDAGVVANAIRQVKPSLVDVSSGVEEAAGIKSVAKIELFVQAVRNA